jgi:DNA-binding response OmpR family regulator
MQGLRILLADDDPIIHSAVVRAAARHECEITSTLRALEIVPLAAAQGFDLIILDLTFPDGDGRQVLKALKSNAKTADIPVVIWSSYDPGPNRRIFLALGAEDYIEKHDAATLLMQVRRILHRGSSPSLVRALRVDEPSELASGERRDR